MDWETQGTIVLADQLVVNGISYEGEPRCLSVHNFGVVRVEGCQRDRDVLLRDSQLQPEISEGLRLDAPFAECLERW